MIEQAALALDLLDECKAERIDYYCFDGCSLTSVSCGTTKGVLRAADSQPRLTPQRPPRRFFGRCRQGPRYEKGDPTASFGKFYPASFAMCSWFKVHCAWRQQIPAQEDMPHNASPFQKDVLHMYVVASHQVNPETREPFSWLALKHAKAHECKPIRQSR